MSAAAEGVAKGGVTRTVLTRSYPGLLLCWIAAVAVWWSVPTTLGSAGATWVALASWLAAVAVVALVSPNGVFSLASGYLSLLGMFHLGLSVPVMLGLAPGPIDQWMNSTATRQATLLVAFATTMFAAGVVWRTASTPPKSSREPVASSPALFLAGTGVSLLGASALSLGLWRLGAMWSGYSELFVTAQSVDPRLFGTGRLLLFQGALVAAVAGRPSHVKWVFLAIAASAAPLFVVGFRGPVIVNVVALVLVWHRREPVAARRLALLAAAVLVILAPAIRVARDVRSQSLVDAVRTSRPLDFFTEAGNSLRPLVETIDRVDSGQEPLWWGKSYLASIARVVPNLSTEWRAGQAGALDVYPAHWISRRAVPEWYEEGGGLGFSAVAEPYLNFGMAGVILFFLGLGWLLAFLDDGSRRRDVYGLAFVMACYGPLLWTVRNDVSELFRAIAWSALLVGLMRMASRRRRSTVEER